MANENKIYLQEANKVFHNKNYEFYLDLYHKSVEGNNSLLNIFEFNIKLKNKRIVSRIDDGLSYLNVLKRSDFLEKYYFNKIVESEFFDPVFYTKNYPVQSKDASNILENSLVHGVKEKLNPSKGFNTAYYLKANPDVAAADV